MFLSLGFRRNLSDHHRTEALSMSRLQGRIVAVIAILFAFNLLQSAVAVAESPASDKVLDAALKKDLQDYLSSRSAIEHISTLSLTVTFRGDSHPINLAVGTIKYGGGRPVTPSDLFQTGSNTKAFTSVLALQLEAAHVLSIDDTLGKWLPQYPAWKAITIRQLLDMTGGIPSYDLTDRANREYGDDPDMKSTPAELVAYVYPKMKTPGAQFEYSNTGYILVQMIIAKASHEHSYEADLHRLIAANHLDDSFYEPYFYPPAIARRLVSGYYVNTDPPVTDNLIGTDTSGYSLGWAQAAGGMLSTPEDLTRWVRALFEGNVLQPEQKSELLSLVSLKTARPITGTSLSDPAAFGLGVFQITDPKLGLFWGYQGSTIGYRATYAYFPSSGLILCVFTNSQTTHAKNRINDELIPALYATLKKNGKP
jgi:D-alanyl-D-alanine carboxypeptidase